MSAPLRSLGSSKSTRFLSLLSPKSVKQKTLPRFLRETLTLPHSLSSVLKSTISSTSDARIHSSEELAAISSALAAFQIKPLLTATAPVEHNYIDTGKRQQLEAAQRRIVESIISMRHPEAEIVLWIGNDSFAYGELQRLICGQGPNRKVMQAFFTYLNRGNKTLKGVDRVKIVKISLAAEIFSQRKGEVPHMRKSPAKYE